MKLKRFLLPPAAIVFGIALFLLFGLMLSLIESITAEAIITVIISNLCLILPAIFSYFYGFKYLKDANQNIGDDKVSSKEYAVVYYMSL